jgi:hypothetical protein
MLFWPRKSDMASPMPVVKTLITQNNRVISGTFAASDSSRSGENPFHPNHRGDRA